ncbi:CoA transferase [Yinghuangia aomiensis]|uniref:CoA transferase n=1 Tax=Yinghuangia aomiensis TaxID=676205 RepID=A0ABP9HDV0_9ACTN
MDRPALGRWAASVGPALGPLVRAGQAFTGLTGVPVDVEDALFRRAALAGYRLPGRTSANGSCHVLACADGWAAVNLARTDDVTAVPALLALLGVEPESADDPLPLLREAARRAPAQEIADAAHLLGMAAAVPGAERGREPLRVDRHGPAGPTSLQGLRVVDLSALWAGPLCARLLRLAGARVTTVESTTRPDGARLGSPEFHAWLHDGHGHRVIDFGSGALADTVAGADLVVEASRPRALRRLGIHAEEFLAARPGRVWVSITGYGRDDDRIAFGDDAAVAGGLLGHDADGGPVFVGDAIADPVTGIYAALGAARSVAAGGGELVAVAMAGCAAEVARCSAGAAVARRATGAGSRGDRADRRGADDERTAEAPHNSGVLLPPC